MSKQHFLVSALAAGGDGGALLAPPERWLQAFPDGQWSNWATLLSSVRAGDTAWVPATYPDWEARVVELLTHQPGCAVVVASGVLQDAEGLRAINAGARGYCHLLAVPELMREVAEVVAHGGLWVGPSLMQRIMAATREALRRSPSVQLPPVDVSVLSERELQVARAVAAGKSNKEVAEQLFISERTVKAHLGAIFEKLGVRDRVQLVLHLTGSQVNA